MKVDRPSLEQVPLYLNRWDSLESYVWQESSLRKLFTETYPHNVDVDDVLIKVCSVNDFYSTNIKFQNTDAAFTVAKHIVDLNIDHRLPNGELTLVNDVAVVKFSDQKTTSFYSFASKYCSHHFPEAYPIYDSFVEKMLMHFRRTDNFFKFKTGDLRHYPTFHSVLMQFSKFYELEDFTLKQIDQYLWLTYKENA